MIMNITNINRVCEVCLKKADFAVERTNDDLPEEYSQYGVRREYFCEEHLPVDAKKIWDEENTV